jgi:RNA polymerase sigma-70 factor (ECF subfamily)
MIQESLNEMTNDELIPTRESLLSRLRNLADNEGWQEFYDTYSELIYKMALKSGLSGADADEVVQETIIGVARKLPEFRYDPSKGSFKLWLLNMARWRISDQIRAKKNQEHFVTNPDPSEGTSPINCIPNRGPSQLEQWWDAEWEQKVSKVAFDRVKLRVDPKKYQIFDLYMVQEWPIRRVAETLGVSIPGVHLISHRVSRLVKKEIKLLEKGFALNQAGL